MPDAPRWRELLDEAAGRVGAADARRIVERASGLEGAQLQVELDGHPSVLALGWWAEMVDRRAAGEPLQYVLGCWGFRTLDLLVDHRVLIPRPETEVVVDAALAEIDRLQRLPSRQAKQQRLPESPALDAAPARPAERRHVTVVDLGTGSGAIALALAVERPVIEVWATDRSPDALDVARANLAGIGRAAARVRLAEGSWFAALPPKLEGEVGVVVANPPYVAEGEGLPSEVAGWEPRGALIAGPTGTEAIAAIVAAAPTWLSRPGALVLEIGETQGPVTRRLAEDHGCVEAEIVPDLAGRDRVLVARW